MKNKKTEEIAEAAIPKSPNASKYNTGLQTSVDTSKPQLYATDRSISSPGIKESDTSTHCGEVRATRKGDDVRAISDSGGVWGATFKSGELGAFTTSDGVGATCDPTLPVIQSLQTIQSIQDTCIVRERARDKRLQQVKTVFIPDNFKEKLVSSRIVSSNSLSTKTLTDIIHSMHFLDR